MNRAMKAAALGAGFSFFVMICVLVFRVHSSIFLSIFWPTHFMASESRSGFWLLLFRVVGFFGNTFLWGLIGYGIGRWMYGKEEATPPPR
jgi:hypothetical protein